MTRKPDHFVLRVDPILCDGFAHCHELAPELVQIDEWGYPIIDERPTPMSELALLKSARLAVRGCPRQALRIERLNGPSEASIRVRASGRLDESD
ncbi:MAG TPA: ferredoxin [Acidimicrobiales bacterium]